MPKFPAVILGRVDLGPTHPNNHLVETEVKRSVALRTVFIDNHNSPRASLALIELLPNLGKILYQCYGFHSLLLLAAAG